MIDGGRKRERITLGGIRLKEREEKKYVSDAGYFEYFLLRRGKVLRCVLRLRVELFLIFRPIAIACAVRIS